MKIHHYTYKITHQNGRYYVGRRSTKKDPLLDPYMGSGVWVRKIKDRSTLTKDIIAYYPNSEELKIGEMELIEKYFDDEYCMNVIYSSCGFSSQDVSGDKNPNYGKTYSHTEETKSKISKNRIGKYVGVLNHRFGTNHTIDTKRLLSEQKIGKNNPNYGKKRTLATKKLISERQYGENNTRASITDEIAKAIKIRLSQQISVKLIVEEFNCSRGVVYGIKSGKTWRHIII